MSVLIILVMHKLLVFVNALGDVCLFLLSMHKSQSPGCHSYHWRAGMWIWLVLRILTAPNPIIFFVLWVSLHLTWSIFHLFLDLVVNGSAQGKRGYSQVTRWFPTHVMGTSSAPRTEFKKSGRGTSLVCVLGEGHRIIILIRRFEMVWAVSSGCPERHGLEFLEIRVRVGGPRTQQRPPRLKIEQLGLFF